MEFHEHASIFPMMSEHEFKGLVEDIREHGLRDPIIVLDGKILDGRNRYRACLEIGIEPKTVEFDNGNPIAFIISHNLHRRHLSESQRAMIGARIATRTKEDKVAYLQHSQKPIVAEIPTTTEAAQMLNVNRDSINNAKIVLREGTPDEISAVEEGRAAVSTLAKRIRDKVPASNRLMKNQPDQNKRRVETMRANAQLWGMYRDAINYLTGLPHPDDMLKVVRSHDKGKITDTKLSIALKWLEEFSDAWNRNSHG